MAYRLGIDLGAAISLAAYLSDKEVRLLPLGDGAAALPSVAHVNADGTVSAGESAHSAALTEPDGLVENPLDMLAAGSLIAINGRKVSGEILLARLLEAILGRAVARFGERPQRTVISHPAGWQGTETTVLAAAAARAGFDDVTIVGADEAVAVAQAVADDQDLFEPAFLAAYGAAVLASKSLSGDLELTQPVPMPLITREDLEGPLVAPAPKRPIIESVYDTEGPATVFTESEPIPAPPAQIPAAPRALPAQPARTVRRSRVGWYVAIAVLLAGVAAVLAVLASQASDSTSDEVAVSSTAPPLVSTSQPVATTATVQATTTVAPTTTSTTTSTTTTTTSTTTTTTIPELPGPGLLALSGLGVVLEPGTSKEANVPFGFDAEAALDRIVNVLGPPDIDSGWVFDEFCTAPEVRVVTIGDLELVFAGQQADGTGVRSFEQWSVAGNDRRRPASLVTRLGAGVGRMVGDLELIYGNDFEVQLDSAAADGSGLFQLDDRGPLAGRTTGIEFDSVLTSISAGLTCQLAID